MYEFVKKLIQVLNFKRARLLLRLILCSVYPGVDSVVNQSLTVYQLQCAAALGGSRERRVFEACQLASQPSLVEGPKG